MEQKTTLNLVAPPEDLETALRLGLPTACTAYRIGQGAHLYRAPTPVELRGGFMAVDSEGFSGQGSPAALAGELLRECSVRHFTGIMLNVRRDPPQLIVELASVLSSRCAQQGLRFVVPPYLADCAGNAAVLTGTGISSGSLQQTIRCAAGHRGAERVALDIERVRIDFTLPAADGAGRALTAEEFDALTRRCRPQPFFSKELCAFYFTYRDAQRPHFVLFDNARSIRRKFALAECMGVRDAFLFYPDIADIAQDLCRSHASE